MPTETYTRPTPDIIDRLSDIFTLHYVNQRGTFPKFVAFNASSSGEPATFSMELADILTVECADPLFEFPDLLDDYDPAQLEFIKAERKRVESFRAKDNQLKLTLLALINAVDPSITTFDQAFTMLRTKTVALAANPLNAQYLNPNE